MVKIDKNLKILLAVGIISVMGIGVFVVNTQTAINNLSSTAIGELNRQPRLQQKAVLVIDRGPENLSEIKLEIEEATTAFDLLKQGAEQLGLSLKTKQYDMGVFIEGIGDKENGQDGQYWLYYVNGEMPPVAADKQAIKPGDKVEFKFEKSPR